MIGDLALTVSKVAQKVPGGILIFFPSYRLMNDTYEEWFNSGRIREITKHKPLYREP